MRTIFGLFIRLGVVLIAASCATVGPPAHLLGNASPPNHPSKVWITGVGRSGASMDQAADAARAAVARQINARITAFFQQVERTAFENGITTDSSSSESRLELEAAFSKAHLIEIAETATHEGMYYALAVLPRDKTARILAEEYRARAAAFRASAEAALRTTAQPAAFTSAWRQASKAFAELGVGGVELAAIDPTYQVDVLGDVRLHGKLRATRERVLQELSAVVVAQRGSAEAEALARAVARELAELGLRMASTREAAGLELEVGVEERCESRAGVCCQWRAALRLNGTSVPFGVDLSGCHPRDRALAREVLGDLLQHAPTRARALREPLRAVLVNVVPWDEPAPIDSDER